MKLVFFLAAVLVFPVSGWGSDFFGDLELVGQGRENEREQQETPLTGYVDTGFGSPAKSFSAETGMRFFRDLSRSLTDYDLYQAVLHFRPVSSLQVDFGRQFVNEGFAVETLDGIRTTLAFSDRATATLYSGVPRSVETGDFSRDDGLLTGLSLATGWNQKLKTTLHLNWRKNDLNRADFVQNDEIRIGTNLSSRWDGFLKPAFYGLVEYETTAKVLEAGTLGVDLTPSRRVSLNLEGNYFNVNRESDRPTVFSLISTGEIWTGRLGSTWTLIPGWLDLVESYSYQRVEIQSGTRRPGHLLDTAFQVSWEKVGLFFQPGYYYAKSFGGDLHGVRGSIHEQFTERLYADLGVDFTTYDKITGDDDNAFSTILWTGYEIVKGWTLSGGAEYNRNNIFERDVRGSFKLEYHYGETS